MKYLVLIATMLLLATSAFAELTEAEKRQELEAAREKMEMARAEFEEARQKLDVDISVELEMAREAMDAAAEALADLHIRELGKNGHEIIKFDMAHAGNFEGGPQLGLIIGPDKHEGGVKLIGITPGSGAQKAGLAAGDRVLEINGKQLKDLKGEQAVEGLMSELEDLEEGELVNLVYESGGKIVKTDVAATRSKGNMWSFLGELGNIDANMDFDVEFFDDVKVGPLHHTSLELSDIDADMGHYFGVKEGVLVISDSREENGFLAGDVVKRINGEDVESAESALEQLSKNNDALHKVTVLRKGRNKNLEIATLEHSMGFPHANFTWTEDSKGSDNKKIVVRQVGTRTTDKDKATHIVVEKKVIKNN